MKTKKRNQEQNAVTRTKRFRVVANRILTILASVFFVIVVGMVIVLVYLVIRWK